MTSRSRSPPATSTPRRHVATMRRPCFVRELSCMTLPHVGRPDPLPRYDEHLPSANDSPALRGNRGCRRRSHSCSLRRTAGDRFGDMSILMIRPRAHPGSLAESAQGRIASEPRLRGGAGRPTHTRCRCGSSQMPPRVAYFAWGRPWETSPNSAICCARASPPEALTTPRLSTIDPARTITR